jgi:hypothetical protein
VRVAARPAPVGPIHRFAFVLVSGSTTRNGRQRLN